MSEREIELLIVILNPTFEAMRAAGIASLHVERNRAVIQMETGEVATIEQPEPRATFF